MSATQAGLVAQGMAPTESPPAESSYGREISDVDVTRFIEDGVRYVKLPVATL
eukprot:COSAG02_NODE_112_length_35994_cov_12.152695_4_plen_53_part_00